MKLVPLYRVTYEDHKPQYFFLREMAEDFRKAKLGDFGKVDITYWYDHAKSNRKS